MPLISTSHSQTLRNVLIQHLPKVVPEKVKIPWKELRKVPKSERKKFREEYVSINFGSDYFKKNVEDRIFRDGFILGINEVTKALEHGNVKSVLISEDVQPRLIVEHVIDQAVMLGTPVLVVPELRTVLKDKCGISSVTVAFLDSPNYKLVQESIENICNNYPVPENHINFNRSHKVIDDSVIIIEDSIIEDISKANLGDIKNVVEDKTPAASKKINDTEDKTGNIEHVNSVYLIRTTKDKRVFIPQETLQEPKKDKKDVDSSDFISFSDNTTSERKVEKNYTSLKVKRLKGNINRSKRKIEDMKGRKNKQKKNKELKKV